MTTMQNAKFRAKLAEAGSDPLTALEIATLQVNVGYRCNLACKHCHISAGPARTEMMDRATVDAVLEALSDSTVPTIDITGGAPELNPLFRHLVASSRKLGKHVIVRTNLAIFSDEGMQDLPEFYRDHDVEVTASLPYYREDTVDRVRGSGTFKKCIAALQKLNSLGYGGPGKRALNLVYNPPGVFLAPDQKVLELEYKKELGDRFQISFDRLYAFTNMPAGRFRDFLVRTGNLEKYLDKLVSAFNPATLGNIMCRHLISVGWDGRLFDCDFNQILGIGVGSGAPAHIRDFDLTALARRAIEVGDHCFGCTAGAGSS
jgi:radical SAM/Cys-rich protein